MKTSTIRFTPEKNTQSSSNSNKNTQAAPTFKGKVVITDELIKEVKDNKAIMAPGMRIVVNLIEKLGGVETIARKTPESFTYTVGAKKNKPLRLRNYLRSNLSKDENKALTLAKEKFKELKAAIK